MASVAFRLTIYQANGTTPDLTVTSVRGGTNPYIVDVPSGDGQEVDLLTGAVRSGAYNVRVADVVTGSTGTGTVRLVTAKLEDADYRQHLLSRRATLECSRNGGSTWAIWTSGYLTALRQTDAMTYEFTVSDSRRLESTHTAFTWWSDTNKITDERREFPNRGCLMGGPLIENFGPIRASGGWEFRWREVQSGYLALAFTAAYDPPAYQRSQYFNPAKFRADARTFLRRLPPVASLTGTNFEQLRDREFVWGYPELLAAVTDGTTTWYGSVRAAFTPVNYSGSGAGDRNLGPDVERSNFIFVELDPNQSTSYPSSNAKVRVRILQREVSEISPIYIDEHPVDIAVKLYKTVGIPYNSSSVTSTKAAVGDDVRLALRIGEPVNMGEFLSNAIFGPFGFSARTNSSGEQEFFPTRIANATAPTTTIAVNDIVGDAPPPVFEVDENTVVTSFRLTAQALTQFVPDSDNKVEPPSDGLVAIENTQVVQNADTTTFSTREVAYEIPGMVHDGSASGAAFVLSPEVVGRFFTGIVAEGFDRFGRGAIVSEVQVLASSTAASLQVGDEVVLNIPYYPNKNYRIGESTVGTRIAQIVRRTEMPEGPIFKLVDSGVNQQPTSPTFTIASWTGDPRRVAQVTVTNAGTLNTAQVTLAVQYQVSANTPTKTGTLFTRFRPGTIPTGAFLLPTVPPGSKVWVRMRTEKTELRASAWTSWTSVTLTSWTAPTSLAAGATTANSVSLSWSLAGNTLDPMDVFAYPGASAPADWTPYRITTLSAGSTTTIVRDLNPSTQYTFGVAFKDIGTGAYSGFTTVTASTNAVNTSTCPAAPKMKVITSFDTAGSTTGVVLSLGAIEGYNVVVQRAPNVAGSPGTWADIAVLAPLTGYYADILPSDGVTRWYRVFYRLSGFLDGAPGTARSAVPVAIPDDLILTEGPSIISGGSSLSFGNYLTGTPDSFYDGSTAQSVAVDATSANTANKVVARDNTGSFSANVVTATLDGPAPAGQLTGSTLAANVLTSSLTSVGTIGTGVWEGTSVGKNYGGTGLTSTAFAGITNERVFAYDGGSGTFFVAPTGSNGQALVYSGGALAWGNPAPGSHVLADTTGLGSQHTTSGLTAGMILQATGATTARFQTPSIPASSVTAGTFSGTSYTITNDLTVSGTLTATLTGNASTATKLATARNINGVAFDGTADITVTAAAGTLTGNTLAAGVTASSLTSVGTLTNLTVTNAINGSVTGNAGTVTNGVYTTGSYADPSWITSLSGSKISGNISGNAANVTGTVAIANGGTNATSYGTSGSGTRAIVYDIGTNAFEAVSAGTSGQFLQSAGSAGDILWATPPNFTSTTAGYAPASGGGTSNFLRADGTWAVPSVGSVSANNVTAGTFSGATYTFSNSVTFSSGVRVAFGETYKILNGAGTAIDVLSATTLGSGVVNSSLTSVGTLTSGAIGSGFTAIANSALANSAITINGTSVSLGGSITVNTSKWTSSGANIYFDTGNVAIGTTPSASYRLLLRGTGATSATYAFGVENSAATNTFYVRDDGNVAIPNGNLGIGTSPSSARLNVNGQTQSNTVIVRTNGGVTSGFLGGRSDWTSGATDNNFAIGSYQPRMTFFTNNSVTERMCIDSAGNVGIGTSSPATQLHIKNSGVAYQQIEAGATYAYLELVTPASSSGYLIKNLATGNSLIDKSLYLWNGNGPIQFVPSNTIANTVTISTAGYLGIGLGATTSASYPLHVAGVVHSSTGGFRFPDGTTQTTAATASQWTTSGSNIYYNSGNVGIGTTSPGANLQVNRSGNGIAQYVYNTGATSQAYVNYGNATTGLYTQAFGTPGGLLVGVDTDASAIVWQGSNNVLRFGTNSLERVRIDASGNLGIGTTSPGEKLHVAGNVYLGGGNQFIRYRTASNWDYYLAASGDNFTMYDSNGIGFINFIYNGGGTSKYTSILGAMYVYLSGNVGIGTSSPSAPLHVDANGSGATVYTGLFTNGSSSTSAYNVVRWTQGASGSATGMIGTGGSATGNPAFQNTFCVGTQSAHSLVFLSSDTERMRITSGGNVGIGTTSPAAKLTVYGTTEGQYLTVDAAAGFAGLSDASNAMVQFRNSSDGNTLLIRTNNSVRTDAAPLSVWTQTTSRFLVRNDGNIGIGTSSPDYRLTILTPTSDATVGFNLRAYTTGADGDRTVISRYTSSNNNNWAWSEYHAWAHIWKANGVEQMRLNSSGNVGIGTSAPGQKLQVNGTILANPGTSGTEYRDIMVGGINGWSNQEAHGIEAVYGAASSPTTFARFDMHYESSTGAGSFRWGKLFKSAGGSGYVMTLTATSTTTADLRVYGKITADNVYVGALTGWAGGRLQVGTTSTSNPAAEFNGTGNSAGLAPVYIWNNAESGNTYFINFYTDGQNNARAYRGDIRYRRNTDTVEIASTSDYRIKTIHGPYTKSGEVFDKIQVHDGTKHEATMGHIPMVVAHELAEAVPYAVEGEKDAVNEDGTPKLQMVSYNAMIPLMLAEIKSLRARVAELEAR